MGDHHKINPHTKIDTSAHKRASDCGGIHAGCAVGIFDATNTTKERRRKVMERVRQEVDRRCVVGGSTSLKLVFIESITNDPELLEWNYKMKLSNKDYSKTDPERALRDFRQRVSMYEKVYHPI